LQVEQALPYIFDRLAPIAPAFFLSKPWVLHALRSQPGARSGDRSRCRKDPAP